MTRERRVFNPYMRAALYLKIKSAFKRIQWQPCNYGCRKNDVELFSIINYNFVSQHFSIIIMYATISTNSSVPF